MAFSVGSAPPGLTLVGVGPGDPELITVAGVRAIRAAAVVAFPVAESAAEGMAATIAAPWITPRQRLLPLPLPMRGAAAAKRCAWRQAADRLAAEVATGQPVVLLCEGDGSLFASSSTVLLALRQRHPHCVPRVIPGVPAVCAAAAAASSAGIPWPLALQSEALLIRPTPDGAADLESLLEQAAGAATVLALLKLGQRWRWVRPLLERRGLLQNALFAQRVGWPDQLVTPAAAVPPEERPYFSLLLIRQGWPPVLP